MDPRHHRNRSPGGRRIAQAERASTGQFSAYDSYYGGPRASQEYVNPRTSADRIVPPSPHYVTHTPSSTASRSSASYDHYSGRPRRSTLDTNAQRPANLLSTSRHSRPAVIHTAHDRPSSPLARGFDDRSRDSGYSTNSSATKREHKKVYSVDDGRSRLIEETEIQRPRDNRETGNHHAYRSHGYNNRSSKEYHYTAPPPIRTQDNEAYYSYTDPARMYTETEPQWRPRRNSVDRGSRPTSVILDPAATPKLSRESGPPPSTRGFDRINGALGRSGSLREPHRSGSRDRNIIYRDGGSDSHVMPSMHDLPVRANTSLPTARDDRARDDRARHRENTYDDHHRTGRHHSRHGTWEDPNVAARGFGVRTGSVDRYSARDRPVDASQIYANPTAPAPISSTPYAEPVLQQPDVRNYLPNDRPEPIPDPQEHQTDRVYPRAPERDREAARENDFERERTRPREDRDRDRERERDRDREKSRRDRDRERERDRDRDRDREHDRTDRGERDRHRGKEERRDRDGDERSHHLAAAGAAVAGTAAAALGAKEIHDRRNRDEAKDDRRDERRDDRRDDRRDERRDDRREDRRDERRREADPVEPQNLPPPPPPPVDHALPQERQHDAPPPVQPPRPTQYERQNTADSDGTDYVPRERHYVEPPKDRSREERRQEPKPTEVLDADEDYRRRMQAVQADLHRGSSSVASTPRDRAFPESDRDGQRQDRDRDIERREHERTGQERGSRDRRDREPIVPVPSRPGEGEVRANGVLGEGLVRDPEDFGDRPDPERDGRVRIVTPPRDGAPAPKGILRKPTEKFPEDPNPIREGVAPMKDAKIGKDIPPNARWTKIDRRLVNPEALRDAKERFEERLDCVIVLRVLSKEDIQKLADRTREIRKAREDEDYDRDDTRERKDYDDDRRCDYDTDDDRDRSSRHHRRRESGGRSRRNYEDDGHGYENSNEEELERLEREERRRRRDREQPRQIEAPSSVPGAYPPPDRD